MRIIGITGGVGSGKSTVLNILKEEYGASVLEADRAAHSLMEPGGITYEPVIQAFGMEILGEDRRIDRRKLGEIVFSSEDKLALLNQITHPAVKAYILDRIENERKKQPEGIFVLEAALLIEEGYEAICHELWYIYADQETRVSRLMENRSYTREKCLAMISSQSDDKFYKTHCKYVIDNSKNIEKTKIQIDNLLKT